MTSWAQRYKTFFMHNSAEHEILNAGKYENIKNYTFSSSDNPRMLFSCSYNCWHFNIYEQEKFHAQLS